MDAACRGCCRLQKGTRMRPTGAVTATDHGCGRARCSNSNGRGGASAEGPIVGVRRSECMRERESREAESTHHLLRRYRRRLFLILPGPIWRMRQRHVDFVRERALKVEGCRASWSRRCRRGLGSAVGLRNFTTRRARELTGFRRLSQALAGLTVRPGGADEEQGLFQTS